MQKIRVVYDSNLDTLVALSKRMSWSEKHYNMASEEFYDKFSKGLLDDTIEFTPFPQDLRPLTSCSIRPSSQRSGRPSSLGQFVKNGDPAAVR